MPPKFDPCAYGKPLARSFAKTKLDATVDEHISGHNKVVAASTVENCNPTLPSTHPVRALKGLPKESLLKQTSSGESSGPAHDLHPNTAVQYPKPAHGPSTPTDCPVEPSEPVVNELSFATIVPALPLRSSQTSPGSVGVDTSASPDSKFMCTKADQCHESSVNTPKQTYVTGSQNKETGQQYRDRQSHPYSEIMLTTTKSSHMVDRNDRLKQLQDASLRQITRKTAARKGKDVGNSVSIRDLDLARAPVNPNDPKASFRLWAHDSPLYDGGYPAELPRSSFQKESSTAPQNSNASLSHLPLAGTTQATSTGARRSRWAVKDEMKADKVEAGSNDWGSAVPSDATKPSNISDASFGKLLRGKDLASQEELLADWEGKMMPPPEDWAERPRYNNNNQDFKNRFREYVRELQGRFSNGVPIAPVPIGLLMTENTHPDGIGMQHRTETIGMKNASRYGYTNDTKDAVKYARPIDESDYDAECELDPADEGNASFDREETTNMLVTNWNKHLANARGESAAIGTTSSEQRSEENESETSKAKPVRMTSPMDDDEDDEYELPQIKPKLNVYLRPATAADLGELVRIYNWYVIHGSQPAELMPVNESAMQSRMDFCNEGKLPFIVAAKKSQKGARPIVLTDSEKFSQRRGLPVTHRQSPALTRIEMLAGFCCVNDFTQPDFVEHISADVEVFVDAQYQRMGVGKCLMDKMLEICDRSHRLSMDVPFHCDAASRHRYGPGGIRDLHKLSIIVRKWSTPKAAVLSLEGARRSRKPAFAKPHEDDYDRWLRQWLQSLGFEVEGHLKEMGAKNGRYIDVIYLSRETCWRPPEGKVPNPAPDFLNAGIVDDEDDDQH